MKQPAQPIVAFVGCALIWGSTFLVIRVGNDSLPALWACTMRFGLAACVLNSILLATGQKWPSGPALKSAALYGLWEFGISMPLLYWGEKVVSSGLAAVLYATCPLSTMFAAKALGMEDLSVKRFFAAFLAFGGVVVIFWRELSQGGSPMGLAAVFLAAAFAPIAALMLQRGPKQSAIGSNAVGSLVGLPICAAASLISGERPSIPTSMREILPVVYLALVSSVGAFVIFAWLTNHWKATTISYLGVVVPVIAVILGALVRHEVFAFGSIAGAVFVFAGVTIALRSEGAKRIT